MSEHNKFMIIKLIVSFFMTAVLLHAQSTKVLVAKHNIQFKNILKQSDLYVAKSNKLPRFCKPLNIEMLQKNRYSVKHFIPRGAVVCTKDVEKFNKESVIFNFGPLEIEKYGKIIQENDRYIKIKKRDGKIEKIYKDGRIR